MSDEKEVAVPVSSEPLVQPKSRNLVDDIRPREPTTSLNPYDFDDDLIPYQATCCHVESCFLRTPDCVGGHGKGMFLCENHEFTCFKPGRNDGEYCVWQVKPVNIFIIENRLLL